MENTKMFLRDDYYDIIPLNEEILVKIPKQWKYERGERFQAINIESNISLKISCYESENCKNVEVEFENIALQYFNTFDQYYKPVSEIIREERVISKVYQTDKTLAYHAITFVQPMASKFAIVCYVFHSTRDLEDDDIKLFQKISKSTLYKVSDLT